MSKEKITVTVDSRERKNSDIVTTVAAHPDIDSWSLDELTVGDFVVEDANVIFERKTMIDLASSITDGRIQRQIERMTEVTNNAFVLVEDDMHHSKNLAHSNLSGKAIRGYVASAMVRHGVPFVFCSDKELLVDMMVRIGRKHIESPGHVAMKKASPVQQGTATERLYRTLPDVGPELAERLAEQEPSIAGLCVTPKSELVDIEGIGEKTADKIVAALHDEYEMLVGQEGNN